MKKLLIYLFLIFSVLNCRAQSRPPVETTHDIKTVGVIKGLDDNALLDVVQRQTFRYFWDFAHPVSGLSRERSNIAYNYGPEVVTIGGSGFGVMSIVVATDRKWITRDQAT